MEIVLITAIGLTIIIVAVIAGVVAVGVTAFRNGSGREFGIMLAQSGALELLTVITVVDAACYLAVATKVTPDSVISLYSGIVGFVLGSMRRSGRSVEKTPKKSDNSE